MSLYTMTISLDLYVCNSFGELNALWFLFVCLFGFFFGFFHIEYMIWINLRQCISAT